MIGRGSLFDEKNDSVDVVHKVGDENSMIVLRNCVVLQLSNRV